MAKSSASVLVADDNRVNRLLLKRHLELLGHHVTAVENGMQALQRLRDEKFDILVLDIEMPELDGFQVLEHLFTDPLFRDFPVIVTSSLEGVENLVRCIELGAEDYLSKPVNPVLLKARLGASLEKKWLRDQQREFASRFTSSLTAHDLAKPGFSLDGQLLYGTVMFCDIRDFTAIVKSQSPEEIIDLLNTYYALISDAITLQGGVISHMTGNGLMALFGAPESLADHEQRAVDAALEIVGMIDQFSDDQIATGKAPIKVGVGIATGDIIAGYTGSNSRATYTCVGDSVNLAAQLESYTKEVKQAILIDAKTKKPLQDGVTCQPLGGVQFKNNDLTEVVFAVKVPLIGQRPQVKVTTLNSAPQRFLPSTREMPDNAVFISYAREDLEAVLRLKAGLEGAGITTWSDVERLEVGDDFDRKIQRNIARCSYFIAVISATTQARHEGYFRREWNYAIDRVRNMADGALFILPVTIDNTTAGEALVPDKFKSLHFTQLVNGQVTDEFRLRLSEFMQHRQNIISNTGNQLE